MYQELEEHDRFGPLFLDNFQSVARKQTWLQETLMQTGRNGEDSRAKVGAKSVSSPVTQSQVHFIEHKCCYKFMSYIHMNVFSQETWPPQIHISNKYPKIMNQCFVQSPKKKKKRCWEYVTGKLKWEETAKPSRGRETRLFHRIWKRKSKINEISSRGWHGSAWNLDTLLWA